MKKDCSILFALAAVLFIGMGAAHAAVLASQSPCAASGGFCGSIPANGTVFNIRQLNFNAPSAGQALVSVNGSGYCENFLFDAAVAEFDTQIVSNPGAPPLLNKFKLVLPARAPNTLTGNGVFNLSSQRLFSVKGAGIQHYAINAVADRMGSSGPRSSHVES
jgi:hypothetical protein